ncbi:MAG TPA: hypothetical protein VJ979_05860 [Actinomycetota bacterium]|nr:hypothetical protein [Actinomycetota bacterium]
MSRRSIAFVLLLLAVAPLGAPGPAIASPVRSEARSAVDIAVLDARIEKAQARVDRWYGRIERWYRRIDRAARRVERVEGAGASTSTTTPVLRRTVSRLRSPVSPLEEAQRDLRRILKDPWARHVQQELDTWSAFLAEMLHARERALRPAPPEDRIRPDGGGDRRDGGGGRRDDGGLLPGEPVTYEGWAGAFLRRLDAPRCDENLLIVVTWETAESTSAAFNPLATTRDMTGATDMNSVGVKNFASLDQGLDASRDTLLLGSESYGYGAIVDSLRRCRPASSTARAINASAWCRGCVGGAYILGLLPIVRTSYAEHAALFVSTSA